MSHHDRSSPRAPPAACMPQNAPECVQLMAAAQLAKPILWLQHLGVKADPAAAVGHCARQALL